MKKAVFIIMLSSIVLIVARGADLKKPKDIIILRGEKAGDVTFNHLKHTQIPNSKCTDCHHKFEQPNNYKSCHTCHGIRNDIGKPIKIFHKTCLDCHKANKKKFKSPRKCKECHSKTD